MKEIRRAENAGFCFGVKQAIEKAEKAGMKVVIPPRKNRKIQREYNKELYKLRHFVENAFMILERWRGVAARYAKNTASFLAAVQIRCIAAWVF